MKRQQVMQNGEGKLLMKINIHSIFESISGEAGGFPQGSYCTFVRFQGCNCRCFYCDTVVSQDEIGMNQRMSVEEIVQQIHTEKVLITGGEPLYQKEGLLELIRALRKIGCIVQIETSGSYEIPEDFITEKDKVYWVVDYKGPSSGMNHMMGAPDLFIKRFM